MKEITPATKSRSTKLSKKTKEELIEVILRKDSVERKLNEKVESYKTSIDEKIAKITTLKQTIGGLENACCKYKAEIETLNKSIVDLEETIKIKDKDISDHKKDFAFAIAQSNNNKKIANIWSTIAIFTIICFTSFIVYSLF